MASKIYNSSNMSKSEVKKMQNALISAGYDVGASGADGIWGSDTAAALKAYKSATGGSNSYGNTVGNETLNKLYGTTQKTNSSNKSTTNSSGKSTTNSSKNYIVKAGDTGAYADIANKAQAYLTDGTYTPGQSIDTDWWGSGNGKATMYGNGKTYKGQAMTTTDIATAQKYAQLYDQKVAEEQQAAALAPYLDMEQQYSNMYSALEEQYASNQAAAQERTQATIDSINSNKEGINSEFEKAQKENYINKVLQQNQMGDYLSAMGYSGGMAESTLQGINNNYANNRQTAISERDSALRNIEQLVAEAQASGNSDLAELASDYYTNYMNTLNNQAQMNYQISQDQQAQANEDRNYQLQLNAQKLNEQMYEDERSDAADKAKQQLAANDFESFLNTYQGKYTKKATYEKWIENLQKLDDPYGYNKQKIAYLRQYINSGMGKTKTKSSDLEDDSSTSKSSQYEQVLKNARTNMGGFRTFGTKAGTASSTVSYVKSMMQKGTISESEAESILKELGLQ